MGILDLNPNFEINGKLRIFAYKNKYMEFSSFKVDLTTFTSKSELYKLFEIITKDMDWVTPRNISCLTDTTWDAKIGVLYDFKIRKIWFDSSTLYSFAYETDKDQNFAEDFIDYLREMPAITQGDIYKITPHIVDDYDDYEPESDEVSDSTFYHYRTWVSSCLFILSNPQINH